MFKVYLVLIAITVILGFYAYTEIISSSAFIALGSR